MARLGSVVACAAILACMALTACSHAATPVAKQSALRSGPIAANLPDGVCAPTYEQLSDANATRIEAKLVTRETLLKNDPTEQPGSGWQPATKYFWMIAEVGSFPAFPEGNFPLLKPFTPKPFGYVLDYLQANVDPSDPESVARPCRAIGFQAGPGLAWPSWYDQMTALADVTIR
jgi:hypothetical protein